MPKCNICGNGPDRRTFTTSQARCTNCQRVMRKIRHEEQRARRPWTGTGRGRPKGAATG